MKYLKILAPLFFVFSLNANGASSGGIGLYAGAGLPFLGQAGLTYSTSGMFSFALGYNLLSLDSGLSKVELSMPEFMIHYHPFSGSFYLGVGAGQETLEVKATDLFTGYTASAKVTATTTIAKMGWMWGASDGGLWFGMDLSFIMPSGGDPDIVAPGLTSTDQAYKDTEDAAKKFGNTSYVNITFAKLGFIF
ncbi:MAG: hypothetical protein KDD61_06430 [Bdellovibrionales bacterium]|nr:hypothetical protein [Bdellovibrionales bacterium]